MKEKTKKRLIAALPIVAVLVLLIAMMSIAMIKDRDKTAPAARASAAAIEPQAIVALHTAEAYVQDNAFTAKMNGTIKARVFGIPYTQKVHGERTCADGDYDERAESVSALVKAAVKRRVEDGKYFTAQGKYRRKSFDYGDPAEMSREDFVASYGKPCLGVVKYETDGAITEAKRVEDGVYSFTLDVKRATEYCKNAVRTMLKGDSYPEYEEVKFTLYMDGNRPTRVTGVEKFRVDKFGGTHCTVEYTEEFSFDK